MSIAGVTLVTALRAACIALVATGLAVECVGSLRRLRGSISGPVLWLMLLTLLMPSMVVGYHVATSRAAAGGWISELIYCGLVLMRVAPLAMVLVWLRPPTSSAEGHYGFSLMGRVSLPRRWVLQMREWRAEFAGVSCLVFIFAFQEFDLAACMNARSWTVALFDAQAGGLALSESLRLMLQPLAIECAALALLFARARTGTSPERREIARDSPGPAILPATILCAILCLPLVGPLLVIFNGFSGLATLQNFALSGEVANSLMLALVAAISAWMLAGWGLQKRIRILLLALPGLLGGLILSLGMLALSQVPPLHWFRSTPLPLVAALILGLMPAALFVRHISDSETRRESVQVARLMGNRRILWTLVKRPALWGGALLFLQAYGDFTANSLLAPPSLTSAFARIFNLMHYGQTTILSAMLLITLAAPVVAALAVTFLARIYFTRREN